jgi:hypothetical protein
VGCGYFDGELRAVADALAGEEPTAHARLAVYAAADKTGMTENYESARQRLTGALQTICEETYSHGGGNVFGTKTAFQNKIMNGRNKIGRHKGSPLVAYSNSTTCS